MKSPDPPGAMDPDLTPTVLTVWLKVPPEELEFHVTTHDAMKFKATMQGYWRGDKKVFSNSIAGVVFPLDGVAKFHADCFRSASVHPDTKPDEVVDNTVPLARRRPGLHLVENDE